MKGLGWKVVGVDPDSKAVQIAREEFDLEVFQGTLEEAKFPDNSFDVITMNHVIEHVPDPIVLLTECRRVLKPEGKLMVVTPNIGSLGRRLFGEYWLHWDPPRHLFLFSPKSLRTCAERAGLIVRAIWTTSKGARFLWEASYLIKRDGNLPGVHLKDRTRD
ncbi:class I SAM-dependent methyltransferase [Thermodesulfovibrio sp. 3462-1]|uniref:Class I SAM-dependent methyltransferase n=1 Tax=Thermodesulfovibrio obliviosus TaxID=3118332 RepID=A0AAU8H2Z3_9BACT